MILLILLIGVFLRLNEIDKLLVFTGDQGRAYLGAVAIIRNGQFPVIGPQTSIPGVYLGPFFYYLIAVPLLLGNLNPVAPAILTSLLGVGAIYLVYRIGRDFFSERVGLLAAFLYASSPLAIIQSRISLEPSPLPLFGLLFIFASLKFFKGERLFIWLVIFSLLIALQLNLSAILLIPLFFSGFFLFDLKKRNVFTLSKILIICLTGFLLFGFFFLGWEQVFKRFPGLIERKLALGWASPSGGFTNPLLFWEIFEKLTTPFSHYFSIFWFIVFSLGVLKAIKSKEGKFLVCWLIFSLAGLFLKKIAAEHSFGIVYSAPAIFISLSLGQLLKSKKRLFLPVLALLGFLLVANTHFLIKNDYFLLRYSIPIRERIKVAKFIIENASGRPFALKRKGQLDVYPATNQNYEYLVFWLGGRIEKNNRDLIYTVYEPKSDVFMFNPKGEIFEFESTTVEVTRR